MIPLTIEMLVGEENSGKKLATIPENSPNEGVIVKQGANTPTAKRILQIVNAIKVIFFTIQIYLPLFSY